MISYIELHPTEFEELIALALSNKQPYAWRAAWLVWGCMEDNDKRIGKHLLSMIQLLGKVKDGHQRNLINVILKMEIAQKYEGLLFDACVAIWISIEKQSSVRFKSFECILKLAKKYPELYSEVLALAQDQYIEPLSEGIKKSMNKMIRSLQ